MNEYLQVIRGAISEKAYSVLATIIHVEGSAYLKEGTVMLFLENDTTIGLISPGCLEEDLNFQAKETAAAGRSRTITYDLRAQDDLTWGQGMGCDGKIHILLEYVNEEMKQDLKTMYAYLEKGIDVLHMKKLTSDYTVAASAYITRTGQSFGQISEDLLNHEGWILPAGTDGSQLIFSQVYSPPHRLLIFGAGQDARPLAAYAAETGFAVTVCDWRPSLCDEQFFPQADKCLTGFPDEILPEMIIDRNDFVVIMSHQFKRDQEILSLLKEQKPGYLAIVGSMKRTEKLFHPGKVPPWVSAPAGLSIGAEGPKEIAISILAEMIATKRQIQKDHQR